MRRCQIKYSFDASFPAKQRLPRVPRWFGLNNHDASLHVDEGAERGGREARKGTIKCTRQDVTG